MVVALCALVLGWLGWTRVTTTRTAVELLRHAPLNAQTYAFLDVELLRRTGVLERLAGARGAEEPEYQAFVQKSGFNYRQHLDAVVMAKRGTAQYAVIAGRFDAARLRAYAEASAGTCTSAYCYVPGTPPISFAPIRDGVYAFASGTGDARELVAAHAPGVQGDFVGTPIWATGLGPGEVPLLQSLPGVERMSVWLVPRLPAAVDLRFALETRDAATATATARELGTLSRAGDLVRILKGSEIGAEGKRVAGRVPLAMEMIEALVAR